MDQLDPRWHHRFELQLDALLIENKRVADELLLRQILAVLSAPWLDSASVESVQEKATAITERLLASYRPWEYNAKSTAERRSAEATQLRQEWQNKFGSLDDPQVQEKLQRVREALLRRDTAPVPKDANSGIFNRTTAAHVDGVKLQEQRNGRTAVRPT